MIGHGIDPTLEAILGDDIRLLTDQEQEVLRKYYVEGFLLREIAKCYNVSNTRATQIRNSALHKLWVADLRRRWRNESKNS